MLTPVSSTRFRKDVKREQKRGADIKKLKDVIRELCAQTPLPVAYIDHPLQGEWRGFRDVHIAPDWLLIYRVRGLDLELVRTGSHADLFRE